MLVIIRIYSNKFNRQKYHGLENPLNHHQKIILHNYPHILCIAGILLMAVTGCDESNSSIVEHPTSENIPAEGGENAVVFTVPPDTLSKAVFPVALNYVAGIGSGAGSKYELFGMISDIEIDCEGRIYILDEQQQDIKIYDSRGNYLSTIGRRGKGPAEFEYARFMTIYNNSWLLVGANYRIEIFDITGLNPEYIRTETFGFSISGLCTVGDKLFVNKASVIHPDAETSELSYPVIHSYSLPGFESLKEFGISYISERAGIIQQMSKGVLSCNETSSMVLFLFNRMPVLRGYDAESGKLKWESYLKGLRYPKVTETIKSGITYRISYARESSYSDRLLPPVSLNDQLMLLQADRRMQREPGSYTQKSQVLSFLLDSRTGEVEYIGRDKPRFKAFRNNYLIAADEDFISAKIYRRE